MKKKDLIYLVVAVAILLAAGYIAYTQVFAPKSSSSSKSVKVEIIGPIKDDFDDATLSKIKNPEAIRDFGVYIDVTTGVNNTAIFGQ